LAGPFAGRTRPVRDAEPSPLGSTGAMTSDRATVRVGEET